MPVPSSRDRIAANKDRTTPSRNPELLDDRVRMTQLERRVNELARTVSGLLDSNKSLQGQLTVALKRIMVLETHRDSVQKLAAEVRDLAATAQPTQTGRPRRSIDVRGDDGSVTHVY